jgi:hypothetical protein
MARVGRRCHMRSASARRRSPTDASTLAAPAVARAGRAASAMPRAASSCRPAVTSCRREPELCDQPGGPAAGPGRRLSRVARRGCGRVTPPTPVLVARRLDATAPSRRFVMLAAWSAGGHGGSRAAAHLWRPLARDGADAERPRPARVGGEQCSRSAALANSVLSVVHALPGSRTFARGQA